MFEVPSAVYGVSLVDITATGVTRGEGLVRNQQRNWETLLQTFGILTQPIVLQSPELHEFTNKDDFAKSKVFTKIGTKHQFVIEMVSPAIKMWVFAIGSEHRDVFGINETSRLNEVFDLVPVIPNLENTIELKPSVFHTTNKEFINIQFFPAKTLV